MTKAKLTSKKKKKNGPVQKRTTKTQTIAIKNVNKPQTKTRIDAAKYDLMRDALLAVIPRSTDGVAFGDLPDLVTAYFKRHRHAWSGSIKWYVTTVKLDLEAHGLVRRIEGVSPQRLRTCK